MQSDDDLLDEITAYLRNEPVPEMPQVFRPKRPERARRALGLTAFAALAASVVGLILWNRPPAPRPAPRMPPVARHSPPASSESRVVVRDVTLSAFIALEADLQRMDVEIADLRFQASLLDARRKADALLAQY